MKAEKQKESPSQMIVKFDQMIYGLLKDNLVPSLPSFGANPTIVLYTWKITSKFNYVRRFEIYDDWYTNKVKFHILSL